MKFGRLRYNRKISMILMYMFLILSIINLAVYPGSRSKYVHAEREVLTYDATLYYQKNLTIKLLGEPYKETPPDGEYQSTFEDAYFQFDFKRNVSISSTSADDYFINIEPTNACTIVDLVANNGATISEDKTHIRYTSAGVDNITGIMKCSVEGITKEVNHEDVISVTVKVNEKVEDKEFLYTEGTYTETLEEYYEKYPIPKEEVEELNWTWTTLTLPDKLSDEFYNDIKTYIEKIDVSPKLTEYLPKDFDYEISDKSLYGILSEIWLDNIVGKYDGSGNANQNYSAYYETIKTYIMKTLNKENAFLEDAEMNLPGLKITHEQTTGGYIHKFEIAENLIGYARTDKEGYQKDYMYFYTDNQEELYKAFHYYLDNYKYLKGLSNEDKKLLKDYVNSFDPSGANGIGYILKNGVIKNTPIKGQIYLKNVLINGFNYYEEDKAIVLHSNILSFANAKINRQIKLDIDYRQLMIDAFKYGVTEIYSNIISKETVNIISKPTNSIGQAITENSTSDGIKDEYSKFSKHFFIYDDQLKNYLFIVVSSDGYHTYVTVENLEYTISKDNIISFDLSNINKESLLYVVQDLDNYFEVATNDDPLHISESDLKNDTYIKVLSNGNLTYNVPLYKVKIEFNYMQLMINDFIASVNDTFGDIISEETVTLISKPSHKIGWSIVKNNTSSGIKDEYLVYSEEYEIQDDTYNWNIMVRIYSDGKNTYATVNKLESTFSLKETDSINVDTEIVDSIQEVSSESITEETNSEVSSNQIVTSIQESVNKTEDEEDSEESLLEDAESIVNTVDETDKDSLQDVEVDKTSKEEIEQSSSDVTDISFEGVESPPEVEVVPEVVPNGTVSGIDSISDNMPLTTE